MYRITIEHAAMAVEKGAAALLAYCQQNNIHAVVTGSSGGLDSAVTLGIAQRACQAGGKIGYELVSYGIIMPCESKPEAEILGREAIRKFQAVEVKIDLTEVFQFAEKALLSPLNEQLYVILKDRPGRALQDFEWSKKIAQGNVKARMRMMFGTYHVARMLGGMVLSTDNLSEYWMGFWTMNGDVGDFGLIQHLMKGTELYEVARYLGVPQGIIAAKPDDGLGISGGDEDQLGAKYPDLDFTMATLIKNGFDINGSMDQLDHLCPVPGIPKETVLKLATRCLRNAFKRRGARTLSRHELGLPEVGETV